MKMKNKKIIVIMIICILVVQVLCTTSFAGFLDGVRGESGSYTPPPTPPDAPQTKPPSTSTPSEDTIGPTIIQCFTGISGNVYEDLGYSVGTGGTDSQKEKIPIKDVIVTLSNGQSTRTDENGNYHFANLSPGTYSVSFAYGALGSDVSASDSKTVENILKYNGHDYITTQLPGEQEYIDMEKIEIEQSGKGALQLFVALDCSYSMRSTIVEYNGKEMSRLSVAVEAAKELCSQLIESGNNIYIGLVFFSGTSYRAVSLTKDLNSLYTALDDINTNDWYNANTNVLGALDKAYESFYNNTEDSNRFITIISDGVPTSDGSTETYSNDSDSTIYSKLDTISQTTAAKIDELKGNGVNIISLITKSEDPSEDEYVQKIFNDGHSTVFENIVDGYKTADLIKKALKDYLISQTQEKHYTSSHIVYAGYEDASRRQEVENNFSNIMDYNNTNIFEQIKEYNSQEKAQELSEKTYMTAQGGEGYTITALPDPPEIKITETDPETGEEVIVKWVKYVEAEYTGQDMVIARRPGFSLVTDITATGLRVILQNGQEIETQTLEPGTDMPLLQTLDNELAHGTTLQIEYTVTIKNDSSIQCNYLELINYLPKKFVYDPNVALISIEGKNGDTGWESISLDELQEQNLITQETLDEYNTNVAMKLVLDNAGQGENGFFIPPGGEYTVRYVVSRLISNLDEIEDPDFGIASEVLKYQDAANRRMLYQVKGNESHQYVGAFPGDSQDQDFSNESTNDVIVIPPTGKETIELPEILSRSIFSYIIDAIIN